MLASDLHPLPNWSYFAGYEYKPIGAFHNYHVTKDNYQWPEVLPTSNCLIDGFSPNLNKALHVGHLKNLAVATALANIACNGKSVAMLGASLGVKAGALESYKDWCELAGYAPKIYFDTELPVPAVALTEGQGEFTGCKMFGDVVIYKSDGKPTYAAHDLSFAQLVKPTHYLTGFEQKQHFVSLGLGNKHIPLGLVLGADGQKMASSGENAMSAESLLASLKLPKKLAWNILAWQFNSASVSHNSKLALTGLQGKYISEVYASHKHDECNDSFATKGFANYSTYYLAKSQQELQPHHVAQFALKLAKIVDSGVSVGYACGILGMLMSKLGMNLCW